jgi:hypothetical protein
MIQSRKIFISLLHRREDVMTIRQINFVAGEAFSRRQMDQMGFPIGNPHKPPFKQKEMPFFIAPAVAAASVAIGTAAAVGSMAAIGTAALATVGAIGTIAAVAGTAMSVVGMVTGDKSLMKLGAIVGLAGGVASLASGAVASLAAGGEFAFGTAGIQSANAANAVNAAAQTGLQSTALLGQATNAITPSNFASGTVQAGTTQGITGAGGTLAQGTMDKLGVINNTGNFVAGSSAGTLGNVGNQIGSGLLQPSFSGAGVEALGATSTVGNVTGSLSTAGSSGYFSKLISDMTPKDYLLMGGSVVSGGMQAVKENQANAAQQQAYEYKQAQRNTQLKNMNTPLTLSPKNTLQVGNYSKNPDLMVNI